MKKLIFTGLLCLFNVSLFAQITYEADFGEKGKKTVEYYDNVFDLPKYEIGFSPIDFLIMPDIAFAFNIDGTYRMSERFWFNLDFTTTYGEGTDFNVIAEELYKPTLNLTGKAHVAITSFETSKEILRSIDYNYNGTGTEVYQMSIPRAMTHRFFGDVGFGFLNYHSTYDGDDFDNSRFYTGGNVSSLYFQVGASYNRSKTWKIITDGNERAYHRNGHFHLNLLVGMRNQFPIYEVGSIPNSSGPATLTYTDVTSTYDFEELTYQNLGWKFGYTFTSGFMNSALGYIIGIEVGGLPGYTNLGDGEGDSSGGTFINFNWGLTFGENIWK